MTDEKARAEGVILRRMLAFDACTYGELCALTRGADPSGRVADRMLQRLRKAGHASFVRSGGFIRWTLTEAGRRTAVETVKDLP